MLFSLGGVLLASACSGYSFVACVSWSSPFCLVFACGVFLWLFFSALRLVFGVGSAWLSPCFVPPCSARPLGLSSGAFWSSQCSAGPSLWVSGCVCDFFVDGANRLSPGHHTWRLTCGPAGNRTATGSLSATSRTSPYQLLHRDAYLVVFATARLSCLAWYRGRNIKNHEKGVRCMSSLRTDTRAVSAPW